MLLRVMPLCVLGLVANAQEGGDLEAQILYAYHIEDANELASMVQLLSAREQAGDTATALRYHLAHTEYRLGLLGGEQRGHKAEWAFAACADELKAVIEKDPKSVETLALQGACDGNLARYRKVERLLLDARSLDRLASAAKLAPHNPRVVYLRAVDGLMRYKLGSTENQVAFEELQQAAQLFEQAPPTNPDVPGWGQAEAYLELGRQLQIRGDVLGARNWIEKSLLVAPHFKAAQRQLGTVARH